MTAAPRSAPRRYAEVDLLKAAGIVTVVFIHSIRSPWDPGVSAAEVWLGHVTRFGVPAFLFASGFLYATSAPVGAARTGRRLRRVGVPYLGASLLAWAVFRGGPGTGSTGSLPLDLLVGSALGPYYYVFVIATLVLATPLFARLPARGLAAATLAAIAAQWAVDAATLWLLPLEWHLRNPLLWWGYFLAGWWVRSHEASVSAWLVRHGRALATGLLPAAAVLAALAGLEGHAPRLLVRTAAWLLVWVALALLFAAASGRGSPRVLARLSDASYAVYLFHLFAVLPLRRALPPPSGALAPLSALLPWAAGLAAPLLLVALARRWLGPRSRDWIGA